MTPGAWQACAGPNSMKRSGAGSGEFPGCTRQPEPGALLILPLVFGEASAIYKTGADIAAQIYRPKGCPRPR